MHAQRALSLGSEASNSESIITVSNKSAGNASWRQSPAALQMRVSKITPCVSKYKLLYGETAIGS